MLTQNANFLGHDIQNELVAVMGKIIERIQADISEAQYYAIIADESKDISKKDKLSIILRYVYRGFIHERFVGNTHSTELNAINRTF